MNEVKNYLSRCSLQGHCVYVVTRHLGAKQWLATFVPKQAIYIQHLDPQRLSCGDAIIGTLPINIIAEICAKNVAYFHLSIKLPIELRGQEMSVSKLAALGAKVERFSVYKQKVS
jgi:CRISPR-associated protein Csx16